MAEQRCPLAYQWRGATHYQVEMFRAPDEKKTPRGVHGGNKSQWEPAGGHGEQVPDAEGVRSSGQPPLPPSGHARAPLLLRPDAPGHGSQIRGTLATFWSKSAKSAGIRRRADGSKRSMGGGANLRERTTRNILPLGQSGGWAYLLLPQVGGTQRPGHAGGRQWPHVGKRHSPDAGRWPPSPVAGRRP